MHHNRSSHKTPQEGGGQKHEPFSCTPRVQFISLVFLNAYKPVLMDLTSERVAWMSVDMGFSLQAISETYASVRACLSILQQYVFQFPLLNDSAMDDDELLALAKKIYRDAIILGFSVVRCTSDKRSSSARAHGGAAVEHLAWGTYRLGVARNGFERKYIVRHIDSLSEIDKAIVLTGFDADPRDDGSFTSIMSAIRVKTITISQLRDCYITAERNRSCPTTLLEHESQAPVPRQETTYDFYADADDDAIEHDEQNSFLRDTFSMKRIEAMETAFDNPMHYGVGGANEAAQSAEGSIQDLARVANRQQTMSSIAPLPRGYKVAHNAPVGQAPAGITSVLQFFEQEIYALVQVPRSMVHQDHERAKVDELAMQRQLLVSVHQWQKRLTKSLNCIAALLRKATRKLPAANAVQFQIVPVADNAQLYEAYTYGIIDFPTMQRLALAKLSLSANLADLQASAPPRLSDGGRPTNLSAARAADAEAGNVRRRSPAPVSQ